MPFCMRDYSKLHSNDVDYGTDHSAQARREVAIFDALLRIEALLQTLINQNQGGGVATLASTAPNPNLPRAT